MRITLLTLAIGIVLSSVAIGQSNSQLGVKAGVGFADYYGSMVDDVDNITSFTAGVYSSYNLFGSLHLQPEALFVLKGANGNFKLDPDRYEKINVGYLQIPLLAKYLVVEGEGLSAGLLVGPAFSFKLFENSTVTEGQINLFETEAKSQELSMLGGVTVEIDRITVDLRFDLGLSDAFDRTNARNRVVSAMIGYSF